MERDERPETSKRREIWQHRHDRAERSPRSQMGDRERAETGWDAGWVPVARRVVRNWERLVEAAVWANPEAGDHSAQTEINAIMEAADEIGNDNLIVARILDEFAYGLAFQMDPLSEGRGVVQFKSALTSVLRQKRGERIDRSKDLWVITDYISELKEKEDIVNIDAIEQAAREGRAPEGEHPEYQAWRTEKLRRFYEILNILNKAADVLAEAAEPEVGSGSANRPLVLSYEEEDLVYLHRRLYSTDAEVVSYTMQPSYRDSKSTAANFSKLHDETIPRDLKQFLKAVPTKPQVLNAKTPINESMGSKIFFRLFRGIASSISEPICRALLMFESICRDLLPVAEKLLNLCMEEAQKDEYTYFEDRGGAIVAHVMNMHQCHLLILRLQETRLCLASIDQSQLLDVNPILVLRELLQTLHDAQILIEASCIATESQWPRAAFEQGDMNHTFSRVLYELEWHTSVLLRMMTFGTSQYVGERSEFSINCDGQLSVEVETALLRAMQRDTEDLIHRLRSMKLADPTEQGLVDQLLNRMEAPSSDLVFQNLDSFDHIGRGYLGKGSYGAVTEYKLLGMECAMKVIEGGRGTEVDREFEKESNAVQKLGNHPHLVRLYCYSKTDDACYLIMERMQMNLAEVLRLKNENGGGLSMVEAVALMLQIGEGLKHIHSKGAAHRDLKPANILVNLADPSSKYLSRIRSVKIADFGLTKTQAAVLTCSNHTRNTGTSVYMAPEVMKLGGDDPERTRFNPAKADVYSFGVVCSEILIGKSPYGGSMSKQMKEQVKAGTLRPNLPTDCPARLSTLIKKCWAGNYGERPLLPEVCRELRYIKGLLLVYIDRVRHKNVRWS